VIAIIACVLVAVAGVYLVLSPDAAGYAAFGWLFLVLGAAGAVGNLLLRARTRQRPGRRP
jgi:hypothetical protein